MEVKDLTLDQINRIHMVLVSKRLQDHLHEDGNPECWMLGYVYDSGLRKQLDNRYKEIIETAGV